MHNRFVQPRFVSIDTSLHWLTGKYRVRGYVGRVKVQEADMLNIPDVAGIEELRLEDWAPLFEPSPIDSQPKAA